MDTSNGKAITLKDAQAHIQSKAMPPGSLGALQTWAIRLCLLQQTLHPKVRKESYAVFCAEHGAARHHEDGGNHVSAYDTELTPKIVAALDKHGAAGTVFADVVGVPKERQFVVDVGVQWPEGKERLKDVRVYKTREGERSDTRNMGRECAMTKEECERAENAGREVLKEIWEGGGNAVALGEVGIGNTTASSALLAVYSGRKVEEVCGMGTSMDEEVMKRKVEFVKGALERHEKILTSGDAREVLCALGGFEIAAIVGAVHEAYRRRVAVLVDGFICSVATLAAVRIWPECAACLFLCTTSPEKGFEICRKELGKAMGDENESAALDMGLRLGEGTGALLCFGALKAAAGIASDMMTFQEALDLL